MLPKKKNARSRMGRAFSLVRTLGRVGPSEPEPIVGAEWRRRNRMGKVPKPSAESLAEPRANDRGAGGAKLRLTVAPMPDEAPDHVLGRGSVPPVLAAQRAAALELVEKRQQERVDAAEALPARAQAARPTEAFVPGHGYMPLWEAYGGAAVEALLDDIDLVDARWLIELADEGGVAPRWQQVPHAARIGPDCIWRLRSAWEERNCLPVVVVSYPWLDSFHPDKHGLQVRLFRAASLGAQIHRHRALLSVVTVAYALSRRDALLLSPRFGCDPSFALPLYPQLKQLASVLRPMVASCGSAHGTLGVFWGASCEARARTLLTT